VPDQLPAVNSPLSPSAETLDFTHILILNAVMFENVPDAIENESLFDGYEFTKSAPLFIFPAEYETPPLFTKVLPLPLASAALPDDSSSFQYPSRLVSSDMF
jgi:hypothetical protein